MLHRLPVSTLFPYTTLFRSGLAVAGRRGIRTGKLSGGGEGVREDGADRRRAERRRADPPREAGPGAWPARQSQGVSGSGARARSEEHTSELQSRENLVCRLL